MFHRSKKKDSVQEKPFVELSIAGNERVTFPDEVVENMRYLLTRLTRENPLPPRVSIVSAIRGEGVTYVSRALGATLSNDLGAKICIVDLNWWHSSTTSCIGPENGGLAAVLAGEAALEDILVDTGWPNLSLIPAGTIAIQNRPALARSPALKKTLEKLNHRFDHLILDIPAILSTVDAVPLASLGASCVLVIHQGATWMEDVKLALDKIDHLTILGAVLNKAKLKTPPSLVKILSAY